MPEQSKFRESKKLLTHTSTPLTLTGQNQAESQHLSLPTSDQNTPLLLQENNKQTPLLKTKLVSKNKSRSRALTILTLTALTLLGLTATIFSFQAIPENQAKASDVSTPTSFQTTSASGIANNEISISNFLDSQHVVEIGQNLHIWDNSLGTKNESCRVESSEDYSCSFILVLKPQEQLETLSFTKVSFETGGDAQNQLHLEIKDNFDGSHRAGPGVFSKSDLNKPIDLNFDTSKHSLVVRFIIKRGSFWINQIKLS